MAEKTGIAWCDHTLNFWIGCQEVSQACDHCYARVQNEHRGWVDGWGPHGERRRTAHSTWHQLLRWNRQAQEAGVRAKVFSNSLSDFFDKAARLQWRREAWHYIEQCPWLDFLILTKRTQNIPGMLPDPETGVKPWGDGWPNVWLGTTVENQEEADRRIPHLLAVPAAVRFLSCEPLLGPVDLRNIKPPGHHHGDAHGWSAIWKNNYIGRPCIDWVICGGESGPGARPMHPDWARSLRDQCASAGVPFFFKQWGEWQPGDEADLPRRFTSPEIENFTCLSSCGFEGRDIGSAFIHKPDRFPQCFPQGEDGDATCVAQWMRRVGKKASGDLLDGVRHHAWPSSPALQVAA